MKNILFYQYVPIEALETFREELFALCESLELKGKILVAEEGINGCLSGEKLEEFMAAMKQDARFTEMGFKVTEADSHTFRKLFVRIRPEIVTFKQQVNMRNKAAYIEPEELKTALDTGEDIIMIDARNGYESKIGRFKGAITPNINLFSEWPEAVKGLEGMKDKKIVTYCTGGIRCEKASAYLKEQGFTNVRQLHGGIIKYGETVGNAHWEGSCFIFDDRLAIPIAEQLEPIAECAHCHKGCDSYHHCIMPKCDKRFICCDDCLHTHEEKCDECTVIVSCSL